MVPTGFLADDCGFDGYNTRYVHGLARVVGDRIDVLAIDAVPRGLGHGGRFIRELMNAYQTVRVLHINNPILVGMLERRGFTSFTRYEDGEFLDGMTWSKP